MQRAAQVSLEWFEGTERYRSMEAIQLAFSLLTRSLRVSHDNLARRDPALVAQVDRWFAAREGVDTRPPALVPVQLGGAALANRIAVEDAAAAAAVRAAHGVEPGLVLDGARLRIARVPGGDGARAVSLAADALSSGADAVLVGESRAGAARQANVAVADRVRNEAGVPTIVAGGIATLDDVSTIVAAGRADLCLLDVGR